MYSKIPGFKFNFDTKVAKVDNREGCEKVCNGRESSAGPVHLPKMAPC